MRATIARWGNSAAIRLPKAFIEALRLAPGQQVELVLEGGEARIRPVRRTSKEHLAEILARADQIGWETQAPSVDWGPDVGAEIIEDDYSANKGR